MFPTLSSLVNYLFGTSFSWLVPTFGFFVAMAFILSYFTFLSEFKRKEKEGVIKPFTQEIITGGGASFKDYFEFGLLGFLIGLKVVGAFIYYASFSRAPLKFIFSLQGSWLFSLLGCVCFCFLIYTYKKKEKLTKPRKDKVIMHPYQLMPKLIIWAAVWGFLGAKVFNFLENFQQYLGHDLIYFLKYSGLTFLGGLTFGAISYLCIGYRRGMKLIDLADIGSPGMLVAYGVGRIGCQLSGDGDWGILNTHPKPFAWLPDWMWSSQFRYNVLNEGVYINGCTGNYCSELPYGVFPTSFYESAIILTCFLLLWVFRKKIKLPGLVFCFYLLVMGVERFFMEKIKLNYKYEVFEASLSEAQIVSLLFIALGTTIGTYILANRNKSPNMSVQF
ncbi:prolipoprotein diacylglyceryl transferase [Desertivirga xinjiangensis]|uniref:prolipoprotein diacylglyceryl transferase n=1 Tax=Desertivirga xinjiangensis TaxID=539206 RepID=UPI00210C41CA|nr:prolipoprotein diacylglyceryl transferase family protein [Pedobacter xinjiangensis]